MGIRWNLERYIMRSINPDNVASWFDPWKLKAYFMFEGYDNYSAPLAKILGVNEDTAKDKVSQSRFRHDETLIIAKALNLSGEQYLEIFAKDVYGEEKAPQK